MIIVQYWPEKLGHKDLGKSLAEHNESSLKNNFSNLKSSLLVHLC